MRRIALATLFLLAGFTMPALAAMDTSAPNTRC